MGHLVLQNFLDLPKSSSSHGPT